MQGSFTDTPIVTKQLRHKNKKISIDMKKIDRIVNYLNPLDFSLNILENKDAILTVQNINVKDDKVFANGLIVIPKDIKE